MLLIAFSGPGRRKAAKRVQAGAGISEVVKTSLTESVSDNLFESSPFRISSINCCGATLVERELRLATRLSSACSFSMDLPLIAVKPVANRRSPTVFSISLIGL